MAQVIEFLHIYGIPDLNFWALGQSRSGPVLVIAGILRLLINRGGYTLSPLSVFLSFCILGKNVRFISELNEPSISRFWAALCWFNYKGVWLFSEFSV